MINIDRQNFIGEGDLLITVQNVKNERSSLAQSPLLPPPSLSQSLVWHQIHLRFLPFLRYGHALPVTATTSGGLHLLGGLVCKTAHNDLHIFFYPRSVRNSCPD
jgi:hypothetical protein